MVVTATLGRAVETAVELAGAAEVADGAEVAGGVVPGAAGAVAVRLGKLLITLLAVLPHPAVRHARTRIAAGRERLLVGRRMSILRVVGRASSLSRRRLRTPARFGGARFCRSRGGVRQAHS
jgi:hypothetical protein